MRDVMHIWALLDVFHKTVGIPKIKAIHDWAEGELVKIAGEVGKVPSDEELVRTAASVEKPKSIPNPDAQPESAPAPEVDPVERKL